MLGSVTGVSSKALRSSSDKVSINKICPVCDKQIHYKQRSIASSRKSFKCPECKDRILSTWSSELGFNVEKDPRSFEKVKQTHLSTNTTSEEFINLVQSMLPNQPWPKQTAQELAAKLSVTTSQIHKVTNILIKRGIFKRQIEGVLVDSDSGKKGVGNKKL